MAEHTSSRLDWIDAAKGTAIILIVFGHSWRGLSTAGLLPLDIFAAIDSRIYAFHLPVFFAFSGLFFISSLAEKPLHAFLYQRIFGLLWPMILWTYLFLGTKVLAGQFANTPASLRDFFVLPVPGVLHLWFLWTLILLSFTFALLRPLLQGRHVPSFVLWAVGGVVIASQFLQISPEVHYWIGNFIEYMPFFFLGIVLSQTGWFSNSSTRSQIICATIFVTLFYFWPIITVFGGRLFGMLLLTLCFMTVHKAIGPIAGSASTRLLVKIGRASMSIYLIHTIFSASLREALLIAEIRNTGLHILLGTGIGVIGPLAILHFAKRTGTTRVLGL